MKRYILPVAALLVAFSANSQSAVDAYSLSRQDLRGTARFLSMGGAFGALGGDLSVLSQNPGGIGIYRSSEIGFTVELDCQRNSMANSGGSAPVNKTFFNLNNVGGVGTLRLNSSTFPNFNFGFSYNKAASFDRNFSSADQVLSMSMSNYMAGLANSGGASVSDLESVPGYDPYNPNDGLYAAPWLAILGFDSRLISPEGDPDSPTWKGLWGNGTKGIGRYTTQTRGGVDEYNISFGGNISNIVFWGMDFGIVDFNYTQQSIWNESLLNAITANNDNVFVNTNADWDLYNYYNVNGSGFNYKLGIIVKPIQELRLGFAFHTPTWYNFTQTFYADVDYNYSGDFTEKGGAQTNNGSDGYSDFRLRTPWHFIFSAAGVISNKVIVSADYEIIPYGKMHLADPSSKDYWGNALINSYAADNADIAKIYTTTHNIRIGAEYRVLPQLSLRAGYSYETSPVSSAAKSGKVDVYPAGTRPYYQFDNATSYITCGLGYRYKAFAVDLAYVHKSRSASFHAFPGDADASGVSPVSKMTANSNRIVLSAAFRF